MEGITTPLQRVWLVRLVAHVALASQVEFDLLEGMQQNTSWTRCSKIYSYWDSGNKVLDVLIYDNHSLMPC